MIDRRLPSAAVSHEDQILRSTEFDDIYFQPGDGLAEVHHVFIAGNDLEDRFNALEPRQQFVIGELGFGTGLNVLAAIERFEACAPTSASLHLVSFEGFSLPPSKLEEIWQHYTELWPELAPAVAYLRNQLPPARPGVVQVFLSPRITLTLGLGPAIEMMPRISFRADAWFLDGFAPSRNPEMWSPELLTEVGRHTKSAGTAATFTVAGAVRRALSDAGFTVEKTPGFGKKREMLRAQMPSGTAPPQRRKVAIIGAGIAGTSLAVQLSARGLAPLLFDAGSDPGAGASGNPFGLLTPRLEASDQPSAFFYRDAFLFARRFYDAYAPAAFTPMAAELRGGDAEQRRWSKIDTIGLWDRSDFSIGAPLENSLTVHQGGLLQPKVALEQLLKGVPAQWNRSLESIEQDPSGQLILHWTQEAAPTCCDVAILCSGMACSAYLDAADDLIGSRGQIDIFRGDSPDHIISDGSYIAPHPDGILAGATYDPVEALAPLQPDQSSTEQNRAHASTLSQEGIGATIGSRAAVRATTNDRHPIAGQLCQAHPHIYAITGLGSRGLSTGPFLAGMLAAHLTDTPSPLDVASAPIVDPTRFTRRRNRRGISAPKV